VNWSDERYVRLYTRDTPEWVTLPWQAKALWPLLLRRMDRAGVIEVRPGPRRSAMVAALVQLPLELVEVGLGALLDDGCLVEATEGYVSPNYMAAQESRASDAKRQRDHRERRRSGMLDGTSSQNVTKRHDLSHGVTPSLAVPSRAVPSRAVPKEEALSVGLATVTPLPPPGAAHIIAMEGVWNENRGKLQGWKMTSAKRQKAARAAHAKHGIDVWKEAVRRLAASAFCTGDNDRGWVAGPDFLLRDGKIEATLEGQYDNRKKMHREKNGALSISCNVANDDDYANDPLFNPKQ
jgi:hypothetical protein